jgi:endonuclease/exonuclease/phosphatase family metal-dependent hydrolase
MRSRSVVLATVAALLVSACASSTPSDAPGSASPAATPAPATLAPAPTPTPTPAPASFTLMDFNIEYGGDEVDFAKVIEAIRLADPDVVALEEAEGNTRKVADALGWAHVSERSQLVSKFPLIDPPKAGGRYEFVEVRPGEVVAVSNVHLPSDPYGPYAVRDGSTVEDVVRLEEETRMPAIQERLDVLPGLVADGIPTFLTGDFNAPSHLDWTEAAVGIREHIKYAVPWPVSSAIEAGGFRDPYRELHPDPVADPGLTWWAGRPLIDGYPDPSEPQDRIDIIYAAGPSTTDEMRIVGEAGGPQVDIAVDPWGSDHRGVVGTFTVTPAAPPALVAVDDRLVRAGSSLMVRYIGGTAGSGFLQVDRVEPDGSRTSVGGPIQLTEPSGVAEVDTSAVGLVPGDYEVSLRDGDTVVATAPFTVAAADAAPTLTLDAASYAVGAPITASWRDAPGARWDWIGVYARGADPLVASYLYYVYTDQGVVGSVVIDEGGEGDWPLPAGEYDAHYLLDDGYTSLAVAPFTVRP